MSDHHSPLSKRRGFIQGAGALGAAAGLGFPFVSRAQNKPIRIGVPTILSGRVAQLGLSSRNAIEMAVERFNAAGGLGGHKVEIVTRDSKGKPDEAANNTRQLVNNEGCEIIIDAEASSGAFAVQEVIRELKVLCIHTCSETSSLSADPKIRVPTAFRCVRQGIHDAIVSAAYAGNVAKAKGLKRWMSCSPDYAYGRDNTALFMEYLKLFHPEIGKPGRFHLGHELRCDLKDDCLEQIVDVERPEVGRSQIVRKRRRHIQGGGGEKTHVEISLTML